VDMIKVGLVSKAVKWHGDRPKGERRRTGWKGWKSGKVGIRAKVI